MARPKPPEQLIPVTYRLTRRQIAKVTSLGGARWLRTIISNAVGSRWGRDPIMYQRSLIDRNKAICADPRSAKECSVDYKLSPTQIRNIRRANVK